MKYKLLKILTILLSPLYLPLGVYIGLTLDSGNFLKSLVLILGAMVVYLADAWIFWYLIESQGSRNERE